MTLTADVNADSESIAAWIMATYKVGGQVQPGQNLDQCDHSFFFFQAEDGIRDYKVTGVQTCALPISLSCGMSSAPTAVRSPSGFSADLIVGGENIDVLLKSTNVSYDPATQIFQADVTRSEERRVGKECRSRWSPYH